MLIQRIVETNYKGTQKKKKSYKENRCEFPGHRSEGKTRFHAMHIAHAIRTYITSSHLKHKKKLDLATI